MFVFLRKLKHCVCVRIRVILSHSACSVAFVTNSLYLGRVLSTKTLVF